MSNQQSHSYTSYTSTSYTSTSTSGSGQGQPHTTSYSERASYNSRDGGFIERQAHETGQPSLIDTRQIPAQGRARLPEGRAEARRIEDVTDKDKEQEARDQEYLERMEEEYAKREGGA